MQYKLHAEEFLNALAEHGPVKAAAPAPAAAGGEGPVASA